MLQNRIKIVTILIFAAFMLFSCTERIEINPGEEFTRLVVDGTFTTDNMAHTILLTATSDYFSNKPVPVVRGANVTISDGSLTYQLRESSPGVYRTGQGVFGVVGHRYTLNIRLVAAVGGHSEYNASSVIYPPANLDSIKLVFHPDNSDEGMWEVKGYWQDPPDMDYYRFLVYRNGELVTNNMIEWFVTDDRFFNGRYVKGVSIAYMRQHRQDEALVQGDRLTIEMNMISKDYTDFILGAQAEIRGSVPLFSGPPANIKGNVDNGAIGFFATYSVSRAVIIVPGRE